MSTSKKVLNIFGIVFAFPTSFIFILLLMVAPLLLSLISLAQPENLANRVTNVDRRQVIEAVVGKSDGETVIPEMEQISKFLDTKAAKELVNVYVTDVAKTLYGEEVAQGITQEKFMKIVDNNIDELAEVFQAVSPEMAELPADERKTKVRELLNESASEVVAALPTPEVLKTQLVEDSPELKEALDILGMLDVIMWSFIGTIVFFALLIFVFRLPGFRGVRWLSVDLLVASILSGVICVPLITTPALLTGLASGNPMVSTLLGAVTVNFATGMLIRTIIMFVFGIGLLVAYIFIKKALKKKKVSAVVVMPVTETPVAENTLAQETAVVAEEILTKEE